MTTKICDHTSVGMLVFKDGKLLLIDRNTVPYGLAQPAGHVDDHGDFEQAARDELREEVGLTATSLRLVSEGRRENACRRPEGSWHHWKMYRVEALGEVETSDREVKGYTWCTKERMQDLVDGKDPQKLTDVSRDLFIDLDVITKWDSI